MPAAHPPATDDLDGIYVWLGPTVAASHLDMGWDSTIGATLAVVRVHEHEPVALIGGALGGAKWSARDGGRIWLDGLVATRLLDHTIGLSAGPIVELSQLQHPRLGGSFGVWGFVGITPFARVGVVQQLGTFVEVGVHVALPVFRR